MINLEGPRQPPKNGEPATALAILLHGYGADGNDLIGLAPVLSSQLPHVEFISPHAPFPCEMSPFGRQWFSLGDRSADAMLGGARMAAQILDDFLNEQLEKYSGRLLAEDLLKKEIKTSPPVTLIHGAADEMVPAEALQHAVKGLEEVGITVTSELRPGLGHSIDERGLEIAKLFLSKILGKFA